MKNSLLRRILVFILAATMLLGQVITAAAASEVQIPDISEGMLNHTPEANDPEEEDTGIIVDPDPQYDVDDENADISTLPSDEEEDLIFGAAGLQDGDGGITISITDLQAGTVVTDGDTVYFTVAIRDQTPNVEPNIKEDSELHIRLPEYLKAVNIPQLLKDNKGFLKDAYYDDGNDTVVLVFKDQKESSVISFNFNIGVQVDAIGYDGETGGVIDVGLGNSTVGVQHSTISIGLGTGTGTGEDISTDEPYLKKSIWSNREDSRFGVTDYVVVRDDSRPVGYAISAGVNNDYDGTITIYDNLGDGNLLLCNNAGDTYASIGRCVTVKVDGQTVSNGDFVNNLGTMNLSRDQNGFYISFTRGEAAAGDGSIVPIQISYFALLTGESVNVTNSASLSIDNEHKDSESSEILKYESSGLLVSKTIIDNGAEVTRINLEEDELEVTFRITFTQRGKSGDVKDGFEIVSDHLTDCFKFQLDKVTVAPEGMYKLVADGQLVKILKNGDGPIPEGKSWVEFTVRIDPEKLPLGDGSTNSVGNEVVIIRRPAKLTIVKQWLGEEKNKGQGAKFSLYDGNKLIASSGGYSTGTEFTILFWSDQLQEGTHTYQLREDVDPDSQYVAARDLDVVIEKTGLKITVKTIGNIAVDAPATTVDVENHPDSGKGSLTFRKLGENKELIDGGEYTLYREVEGGEDEEVKTFSTADGVKVFEALPYGIYYVKEISAPAGYIIQGSSDSPHVELKKIAPNQSVQITNSKYRDGEIEILKKDQEDNAVPGVTFTLTATASGATRIATTDSSGVARFTRLEAGSYVITETPLSGYEGFTGPIVVTIDEKGSAIVITAGTDSTATGKKITINWTNLLLHGKLTITKIGESSDIKLSGAEFALYRGDKLVGSGATDDNGVLVFDNLPYGSYILKEVTAPRGYLISTEMSEGIEVTIDSLERSCPVQNIQQTGSITITKTDGDKGLSGALFGLFTAEEAVDHIRAATTGSDGRCSFENLKSGIYYVRELAAPTGYTLSNAVHSFKVGVVEGETQEVWTHTASIENDKKLYKLKLIKTNEDGSIKLSGAEFTLSGNGIETMTAISDDVGSVVFENVPYGVYTVTETRAPKGYVPVAPMEVRVDGNNTPLNYTRDQIVDCGIVENCHTRLTVLKVDDKATDRGLPGSSFVIMSEDKYVTARPENGAYIFTGFEAEGTEFVTGDGGVFTLEYLPIGNYTLKETAAPVGYIIATETKDFSIANAEQSVTVGNTQIRAAVQLVKTDGHGKLLANIGFTVRTAEGYVQAEGNPGSYSFTGFDENEFVMYTDQKGELSITNLLWGTYTIDEAENTTPAGLIPVHGIPFTVSADKHNAVIPIEAVNPLRAGDITLKKVDTGNEVLPGAVFRAVCISGSDYSDNEVRYAVSDANGVVTFKDLPYGVYEVSEYLAPYGFELSEEKYYLSACNAPAPEGITLSKTPVTCVNEEREIEVTVKKVSLSGEPLSGLVFYITDENMNPVTGDIPLNNSNGTAEIKLPFGNYYLIEKVAPANYIKLEEPVPFTVSVGGRNEIVLENAPFTGALKLTKVDQDGNKLAGAEFAVYDALDYVTNGASAQPLYTLVTDSNGTAALSDIPFGNYAIAETKAPEGYAADFTAQYFEIDDQNEEAVVELSFENQLLRYAFLLEKRDINSGSPLAGASFLVYGDRLHTVVTVGNEGKAIVEVPGPGTYYILEVEAPEGYTLDPNVHEVEVTEPISGVDELTGEPMLFNASFVSRDYPTQLIINKVDENGERLEGASFVILNENGEEMPLSATESGYIYDPASANTEFSIGAALITNLPAGSYTVHEVKAPEGYMPLPDIRFVFDSSEFDKPVEIVAENLPYQRGVAVCKENEAGVRLTGAEFTLFDANDEVLATKTTTASGYAVFSELESGSYTIRETAAPVGYLLDDTVIEFTIDGEGVLSGEGFVRYGTEEMPFYVVTMVNKPVTYSFKIVKTSGMNGALLNGAEFRIIGNGVNMTVTTVGGYAEFKDLPVGEYMLTEIKAPEGYTADATGHFVAVTPEGVSIDGTALEDELMEFEVENEPLPFELRIEKLDEDSRKPLEGAAFTLTGPDGSKYYLITDASGRTESVTLMPGEYTVTESVAPKGYNVSLAGWSFTVEEGTMRVLNTDGRSDISFEGNTLTLRLTNKRTTGSLLIYKYDGSNGNAPLAGAKFRIRNADGEIVFFTLVNGIYRAASSTEPGAGNVVTTNAMGQALVENLEFGEYTVREVRAPVGYQLKTEGQLIKLTNQDETLKLSFENEQLKRTVSVKKVSAGDDKKLLIGAVFALYTVKDGEPGELVAESTTGYDGIARFTVPYGDYLIVETRAPEGYQLSGQPPVEFSYNADTPEDEPFEFTFENEKTRYAIEAYKYDESDPSKVLAGAKFAFTDSRGYTKIVETGADGIARLEDVAFDDYTVREVYAPEGYYLNDKEYVVHKEELIHNAVVRVEVSDKYILGSVHLKKVDFEDKTKVLDASFVITDANGNELKWLKNDEGYELAENGETVIHAGNIRLTKIPAGDYTITEVESPDGYLKLDESRSFSITADNAEVGIKITIKNLIRKVAVGILKVDSTDITKRLEGAEFTLYAAKGDIIGEAISTVATDENGQAVFTDLTMGEYIIKETKAPYGYKLWKATLPVSVDADGNVTVANQRVPDSDSVHMVRMRNERILKDFAILKLDADTLKTLPGAEFKISGPDGTANYTTNKNGLIQLKLPYGDYVVEEIIAPEGYVLSEEKHTLSISEDGMIFDGTAVKAAKVELANEAIKYPFLLYKKDASGEYPLSGAEFTVEGTGVNEKLVTDRYGFTKPVMLRPGEYTITETRAPEGYDKPLTGWTLTVKEDGTMLIDGKNASIAQSGLSWIASVTNTKTPPPGGFVKTGESGGSRMLMTGAFLVLSSFAGLLFLAIDEAKRRCCINRL